MVSEAKDWFFEVTCTGARDRGPEARAEARAGARGWAGLRGLTTIDIYTPAADGAHDPFNDDGAGPLFIAMVAFSGAETSSAPTVRTARGVESLRTPVSGCAGVATGAGGVESFGNAVAVDSGVTSGGVAPSVRPRVNMLMPNANNARAATPMIHGFVERFSGPAPFCAIAVWASDLTTTVGSDPVMRDR